jgi:hypothetical protein
MQHPEQLNFSQKETMETTSGSAIRDAIGSSLNGVRLEPLLS